MGIPGLTRQLQRYGQRERRKIDGSADLVNVIIDGPALAYHIYYLCLAQRKHRSPFDNIPSHDELSRTLLVWLQTIAQCGFNVQKIFFDGFLPPYKFEERVKRLQGYVDSLRSLRESYDDDHLGHIRPPPSTLPSLFREATPSSQPTVQPPLCFVSCIINSLQDSEYSCATQVVPGEADSFCAEHARSYSALVMTSDSDLLIQDISQNSRVLLLKDVTFEADGSQRFMDFVTFHPRAIAASLELDDLIGVAYMVLADKSRTIQEATKMAKSDDFTDSSDFRLFKARYDSKADRPRLLRTLPVATETEFELTGQNTDIRFLELVYQVQYRPVTSEAHGEPHGLPFFLPFMTDDTMKASAFIPSTPVRAIAYSLLGLIDCRITRVAEYHRSGGRIISTTVPTLLLEDSQGSRHLLNRLQHAQRAFRHLPSAASWRAVAMDMVSKYLEANGKAMAPAGIVQVVVLNDQLPVLSWDFIHTQAQMQATLYSFTIVQQALRLVEVLRPHLNISDSGTGLMEEIASTFESLPRLSNILDWSNSVAEIPKSELCDVRDALAAISRPEERFKRRKRNTAGESQRGRPKLDPALKSNPFAALSQD